MSDLVPQRKDEAAPQEIKTQEEQLHIPPGFLGLPSEGLNNHPSVMSGTHTGIEVSFQQTPASLPLGDRLINPDILAKYSEALPNGAERVFALIEDRHQMARERIQHQNNMDEQVQALNSKHHDLDKYEVEQRYKLAGRGQLLGLVALLLVLGVGAFMALKGFQIASVGLFAAVGFVSVFVTGKHVLLRSRIFKDGSDEKPEGKSSKRDTPSNPPT